MATIDATRGVMTLINTFEVEPKDADRLVAMLVAATNETMRARKGFISASIHKSGDGTRVVNYAQWASKADFEAMRADPEAQKHMKECAQIAKSFDPRIYTVADSITV
jgi:quinol monooxygenase YgiN